LQHETSRKPLNIKKKMAAQGHEEGRDDLLPVTTVHAFPVNTFIENIAVRRTGQLLLTVHNKGELIQLDPNSEAEPCLVHVFSTGVCGIVEVQDDIFYISCGTIGEKGSWAVYKVDMSPFIADTAGSVQSPAKITQHVDVPDALFLNGSALLSYLTGTILLADSILGAVYSVDVQAATVKLWLQHEALGKVTDNPMMPGVNGIKFHNGYLYLSNTDARKFLRASVTSTGDATGMVEVVQENLNVDDFCFDSDGSAYLTTHVFQSLVKLRSNGRRVRLAGGPEDAIVSGTTAAAFGRTSRDRTVLYVTTTGGMSNPVAGKIEPGRVLKLDVGNTGATDFRPGKVLFVTTSHDHLDNGAQTGVWLEEAAEPYLELTGQGIEVVMASPKGGTVPIDPRSKPSATQSALWQQSIKALENSVPLSGLYSYQFDGVFLPGGHGPMFDLAKDETLASLLRDFHSEQKPIGAVCHGPAGLANVKLDSGKYLVAGKEVTSYSWAEEILAQLDKDVPFNLQQALSEHGGLYTAPHPRKSHVVVDGLLVTGQNPASSRDTASAFAKVLCSYRTRNYLPSATSSKYRVICQVRNDVRGSSATVQLRPKHIDWLSKNKHRIMVCGPVTDEQGTPVAMTMIIEAESETDAESFLATEPYTASGIVFSSVDFLKWHQVVPDMLKYELAKITE
jgi:putative intracellular protease/amidase/uncharacterized protein YciI